MAQIVLHAEGAARILDLTEAAHVINGLINVRDQALPWIRMMGARGVVPGIKLYGCFAVA